MVGNFLYQLPPPLRKPGNAGSTEVPAGLESQRPPVAAEGTLVSGAQRTENETVWRPAGQTQRGPGPTCGQRF